ncbi:hypothetical protein K505DRAFT_289676, partial [Melanomma pulvis-pyrius CBS 109.77]
MEIEPTVAERPPPIGHQRQATNSRRRFRNQDWEEHRDVLHQLYMVEDNSLLAVMERMQQGYNFGPTQKQYKDKFKSWKWIKRLPGDVAQWMVEKASQREIVDGKQTIFSFKGQSWTGEQAANSATRTRKVIVVDTPADLNWETPKNPGEHASPAEQSRKLTAQGGEAEVVELEPATRKQTFPLTWNGRNRANLLEVLEMARDSSREGHLDRAEAEFMEALEGHRYLLTPTHEETVKIAYELANFYAEQQRVRETDEVLERISEDFIERWGVEHKKTYQHGLDMVDLLKNWNREIDALAILSHVQDAYERAHEEPPRRGRAQLGKNTVFRAESPATRLQNIRNDMSDSPSSSRIDHGIGAARAYVATGEPVVEELIKKIEDICVRDAGMFAKQALQARAELLKLYNKLNATVEHVDTFVGTRQLWDMCWDEFSWEREKISSLDFLEASMEVAAALLVGGFGDSSWSMFRKIEDKAVKLFGFDDERTIWTVISVGLIYQSAKGWDEARPWFEQALSAALSAYDEEDGMVKSLESAMDKRHFSYITDE